MWDSLGRGVTARNDERARRIVLEYDERADDAAALKAAIAADAKRLGWERDVQELLEKGVALPTVVRFLEWAHKSKRGPDASSR